MALKRQLPSPVVSTGQKSELLPKIEAETVSMTKAGLSKSVWRLEFLWQKPHENHFQFNCFNGIPVLI